MSVCRLSIVSISALLVFMLLSPPGQGFAQQHRGLGTFVNPPKGCFVIDPVDTESLYSFMKAQIQALSLASAGEVSNSEVLTAKNGPPVDEMAKVLAGLRQERIEDTCASFVISVYSASKNPTIGMAAKLLGLAYEDLGGITEETLKATLQETLPRRMPGTSTFPELKSKRKEILGQIAQVLNISLEMLVDGNRTDSEGKPDHIILTQMQKDDLLDYLHSQFPNLKPNQKGAPSGEFLKQAALIESFLSGQYKPADR